MAATIKDVRSTSGNGVSIQLAAFGTDPSNGDCIVVAYGHYNFGAGTPLAPQDTQGNLYTQIGTTRVNGLAGQSLWIAKNITGGATFKVTCRPNGTFYAVEAWCLTGVDPDPFNNDWVAQKASSNPALNSTLSSQVPWPNSIALGFASIANATVLTDGAGWNTTGVNGMTAAMVTRARVADYAANFDIFGEYKLTSTQEDAVWGNGVAAVWVAQIASFAPLRVPVVTSLDKSIGTNTGGTTVTITGTGFYAGAGVTFDGVAATSVVVVNSTTITCVTPAHANATIDVVVTNANGQTSTLAASFTFATPPTVTEVTPVFVLLPVSGATATIIGTDFVAGATVNFGATAATGVVVVDAQTITCDIPSHAAGSVLVTVINPDTLDSGVSSSSFAYVQPSLIPTTVTGRGLFQYTSVLPNEDVRRVPSITIRDVLNNAPNEATFLVDGASAPPAVGTPVIFTDEDTLIFRGQVQTVDQMFEDIPENLVWSVRAVDPTYRLNAKRPFGTYDNVSVTEIVKDLVARYAPGFTTVHVQTNLPRVSIVFDGRQDFNTCLTALAQQLGEGHWYADYDFDLHFYRVSLLNVPTSDLPYVPLQLGPGTSMTVSQSSTVNDGSLPPGYYYFQTVFHYRSTATFTAPPVATPSGYMQLSDQAAALNLGGSISNGSYATSDTNIFPRGWIGFNGLGQYIASPGPTLNAGDVYFASPDVRSVLESAALSIFESAPSPISNVVLLTNYMPSFSNIPLGPVLGGRTCTMRLIYFVRFGDFHGAGGTPLTGYAVIGDNTTTGPVTLAPAFFYGNILKTYVSPPAAPSGTPNAAESVVDIDNTAFLGLDCQPGYYAVKIAGVYKDGTESYPSPASNVAYMSGPFQMQITNMPTFPDVNGVPCIFRKVYASIGFPYHPPDPQFLPDFLPGHSNLCSIVLDNTSISTLLPLGSGLSGGGGDVPIGCPVGTVSNVTVSADGPNPEDGDAPTDLTDNNPYLLLDPPLMTSTDQSQLRNRIFVIGKGTILTADAAIGDREIKVADVSQFTPRGGTAINGSTLYPYIGLSTIVGAGSVILASPLTKPVLQADWKFGGGTPMRPFVQVDDLESQKQMGAVELDALGQPTDGVHEYTIDDNNLATTEQCIARGLAELQLFSRPIVNLTYATRDPLTKSGKVIHVDMVDPPVQGDFVIQEVVIDQIRDESDQITPRYTVRADSAARFNFNDLLLHLDDARGGGGGGNSGPSTANITEAAAILSVDASGGLSFVDFSLTVAQILTLNSIPQVAIPAPEAGKVIVPVFMWIHAKFTNTWITSRSCSLRYARDSSAVSVGQNDILGSIGSVWTNVATNRWFWCSQIGSSSTFFDMTVPAPNFGSPVGKAVMIMASGDNAGGNPDGTYNFRIAFFVVDSLDQ